MLSAAAPGMVEVLREAIKNVREFHLQQKDESWEFYAGDGVRLGVRNNAAGQRRACIFPGARPPILLRC